MPTITHEFNYATWTPDTRLTFVRVPWDNEYKSTVRFQNRANLDAWIDSQSTPTGRIDRMSYAPVHRPIRVNIPFNKVIQYNYVRAANPAQPIPGNDIARSFYYFILDAVYVSANVTELIVQMDEWTNWIYDLEVLQGYVERGHFPIAAGNAFDNYGRDYLAVPEGLDTGSNYRTVSVRTNEIMGLNSGGGVLRMEYDVLVVSTIDLLNEDRGDYYQPKKWAATGSNFEGLSHAASFYVFEDPQNFRAWIEAMSQYSWILQGIISITVIPKFTRYFPDFDYGDGNLPKDASGFHPFPKLIDMFPNWRNSDEIRNTLSARYRNLRKFDTFPYMAIEITTNTGTPITLRPEAWNNADARIMERASFTPPNQRVEITPRGYNARTGAIVQHYGNVDINTVEPSVRYLFAEKGDDGGDYLDLMTRVTNFPTMAILNDQATLYLANNAHSLQSAYKQVDWAENKAQRAAALGRTNAGTGIQASGDLAALGRTTDTAATNIGINAAYQSFGVDSIAQIASGAGGGLTGGLPGAAVGTASAIAGVAANAAKLGISTDATNAQLANRNAASTKGNAISSAAGQKIADANYAMASYNAGTDETIARQAIMSKVQDTELIPPAVVGQQGGESMNLVHYTFETSVRFKRIDDAMISKIGEFWLRYGYAVERFIRNIPADLHVMNKFTYWKMSEVMLSNGPAPESGRATVRGILTRGTTVYKNPGDIGTIDYAANSPLEGINF